MKRKNFVPYDVCIFCSHRLEKAETFQRVPQWTQKSPIHQSLTFTCVVMLVFRYSILCGMVTVKDNTGCWYFPHSFTQETNGTTPICVFRFFICAIHSALLSLLKSERNNETKQTCSTPCAFLLCFCPVCVLLWMVTRYLDYFTELPLAFSWNGYPVPGKQRFDSTIVVSRFLVISSFQSETIN